MLETTEIIEIFEQFLNERSLFFDFKEWIESKGYDLAEFGISED